MVHFNVTEIIDNNNLCIPESAKILRMAHLGIADGYYIEQAISFCSSITLHFIVKLL
jgi:hypothetical protein